MGKSVWPTPRDSEDSDDDSSDEEMKPDEEAEMVAHFVSLLFAHKQAFEAESKQAYEACREVLKDLGTVPMDWYVTNNEECLLTWIQDLRNYDAEESAGTVFPDARWYHLRVLKLVWSSSSFTTSQIYRTMRVLGPDANKFVHSLSVRVPDAMIRGHTLQLQDKRSQVQVLCGTFGGTGTDKLSQEEFSVLQELAPRRVASNHRSMVSIVCGASIKVGVQLHYCGVPALAEAVIHQDAEGVDRTHDALLFTLALEDSYDETNLFTPPVAQALVWRNWELAWPEYAYQRIMDVFFQLALLYCCTPHCRSSHSGFYTRPEIWELVVISFFSVRGLINVFTELVSIIRQPGAIELFLKAYFDFYMAVSLYLEINIVFFTKRLIEEHYHDPAVEHRVLYKRPFWYFFIILGKALIGTISTLNLSAAMEAVLPAWLTLRHKDSLMFMLSLVIISSLAAFSYYSLPIPDLVGAKTMKDSVLLAFTRMMRVIVFADYDSEELEGLEKVLVKNTTFKYVNGSGYQLVSETYRIEDTNGTPAIHRDLMWLPLLLAVTFSVIFLNVYIGVLAEVYAKVKENMIQHAGRFRVLSTFRYLLIRQAYFGTWFRRFDWLCVRRVRGNVPDAVNPEGFWIKIPSRMVVEPQI